MTRTRYSRFQLRSEDQLAFLLMPGSRFNDACSILTGWLPAQRVAPIAVEPTRLWSRDDRSELKKFKLLIPRQGYGVHKLFERKPVFCAALSNPLELVALEYEHFLGRSEKGSSKASIEEFLRRPEARIVSGNAQVRQLASSYQEKRQPPPKSVLFEMAKARLEEFAFIGLTNQWAEAIRLIHFTFGWELRSPEDIQLPEVPASDPSVIPDELAEYVTRTNPLDMDLFEHASKLVKSRLRQMTSELQERELAGVVAESVTRVNLQMQSSSEIPSQSGLRGRLADDDVLFFLHIPKSAGLSIISLLDSRFRVDEILPLHSAPTADLFDIYSQEQLRRIRFVRGHFLFGPKDDRIYRYIVQNPVVITMLRNPVDRIVSAYRHTIRNPRIEVYPKRIVVDQEPIYSQKELQAGTEQMVLHEQAKDLSLKEYVTDPRFFTRVFNRQTRMVLGGLTGFPRSPDSIGTYSEEALVELAKAQLDQFLFVGIQERFEESVQLMAYALGWEPFRDIPVVNVSPATLIENSVDHDTLEAIREMTRIDSAIYEFALELFRRRRSAVLDDLLAKNYLERTSAGKKGAARSDGDRSGAQHLEELEEESKELAPEHVSFERSTFLAQQELSKVHRELYKATNRLERVQRRLHSEVAQRRAALDQLQRLRLRFEHYKAAPEGLVLYSWMARKEVLLPALSIRRRVYDGVLLRTISVLASLLSGARRLSFRTLRVSRRTRRDQEILSAHRRQDYKRMFAVADPDYWAHVVRFEPNSEDLADQAATAHQWGSDRSLTLVTEVGEMPLEVLKQNIESVLGQTFSHWQWVIVDASSNVDIRATLLELATDARILVLHGTPKPSPIENLNMALSRVATDYVAILDSRSALASDALFSLAEAVRLDPSIDIIYADEDKLDEFGYREDPFFKPDWSPELMLSLNYLGSICFLRSKLVREIGFLAAEAGSEAVFDLYLRASEQSNNIHHLPQVLCHVRSYLPGSEVGFGFSTVDSTQAHLVVEQHLVRDGLPEPSVSLGGANFRIIEWRSPREREVSIVIPSKDNPEYLEKCLNSLFDLTRYGNYQVILVDTGSVEPDTFDLYKQFTSHSKFEKVDFNEPFNFSKACNFGRGFAHGDLLLFLNDDTEVLVPNWLRSMTKWFDKPGVGAVGAQLLYPDGKLQHSGVIVGMGGLASHLFEREGTDTTSIFGKPSWYRNLSAVTAACMLVSSDIFDAVGGFDEEYELNYSDVDLCVKITRAGWRIVFAPDVQLIHSEAQSHGKRIPRSDFVRASDRLQVAGALNGDPYFNPNLSYMSALPTFRNSTEDTPQSLNRSLMNRLPRKEIIQLPDDLR